jgi:hypothetical protein
MSSYRGDGDSGSGPPSLLSNPQTMPQRHSPMSPDLRQIRLHLQHSHGTLQQCSLARRASDGCRGISPANGGGVVRPEPEPDSYKCIRMRSQIVAAERPFMLCSPVVRRSLSSNSPAVS